MKKSTNKSTFLQKKSYNLKFKTRRKDLRTLVVRLERSKSDLLGVLKTVFRWPFFTPKLPLNLINLISHLVLNSQQRAMLTSLTWCSLNLF